jgi:hypothetical protein
MILALPAIVLVQCKKKADPEADRKAVEQLVGRDSSWFNTNVKSDTNHGGEGTPPVFEAKAGSVPSADTTIWWWRGAQTFYDPEMNVSVVGDSAYVDWARDVRTGFLNVLAKTRPDTLELWLKRVFETVRIRGIFRRTGKESDSLRGWALQKISLVTGTSDTINSIVIDSVRIRSQSNPNLVIRDPLNTFYRLDSLTRFTSGELCSLWLYTNATDDTACLHTFVGLWYLRAGFTLLGNGVYFGAWRTQLLEFPRFVIFDVMDRRSLRTPSYGYDYNGWLFPYRIKNEAQPPD